MSAEPHQTARSTDPLGSLRLVGRVVIGLAVAGLAVPIVLYLTSHDDDDDDEQEPDHDH